MGCGEERFAFRRSRVAGVGAHGRLEHGVPLYAHMHRISAIACGPYILLLLILTKSRL